MPIYSFECGRGHRFDETRKVAERDAPAACPEAVVSIDADEEVSGVRICGEQAQRALTAPASRFPGADKW